MWLNEYHADFLARDRLAEARADAARRDLIAQLRRSELRRVVGEALIHLGRLITGEAKIATS
jgi:hypothetical protein